MQAKNVMLTGLPNGVLSSRVKFSSYSRVYLSLVIVIGAGIFVWGLSHLSSFQPQSYFVLYLGLAVVSALFSRSVAKSDKTGISYVIGPILSLSLVPLMGVGSAVVLGTIYVVGVWLINASNKGTWKKWYSQLAFNISIHSIAAISAGGALLYIKDLLGPESPWGQIVPWLPAAFIYAAINRWLLSSISHLQHGAKSNPLSVWQYDRWTSQLGIVVLAVGSSLLAFATQHYDGVVIVMFFVPVMLSAYAFHLYVAEQRDRHTQLEEMVSKRTADLADLNKQKDAFLAVLTHDMLSPLTSIQLYAEEIKQKPETVLANPQMADLMLLSHRTIYGLVRSIIDLEQLQSGRTLCTQKEMTNLSELIMQIVESMQPEAVHKQVELSNCARVHHNYFASIDRLQIERVLRNLISNAIKYTPPGGEIAVDAHGTKESFTVTVTDTGYGIPDDELPYIFERYRRVSILEDKATGTGLGLAITKALVEEHGGSISVQSVNGTGSRFTIVLPNS